jgi:hypothetical protein
MKSLRALIVIGLLGTCLAACGGSSKSASSSSPPSSTVKATTAAAASTTPTNTPPEPAKTKADTDKDNDIGAPGDDTNNDSTLNFGHAADAADTHAITSLIKRYYAAAYTENGAKACKLLYSTLEEAVPEDYGQSPPSQPYMRGTTCTAVLTLLFKHYHPQLTVEMPKLTVARVRLIEHHGIAILNFGSLPQRQIPVAREGHIWKIEALLDSEVP